MNEKSMNHQLAIQNTKEAIERARASGNIHEVDFLSRKTLPRLEKLVAETCVDQCRK